GAGAGAEVGVGAGAGAGASAGGASAPSASPVGTEIVAAAAAIRNLDFIGAHSLLFRPGRRRRVRRRDPGRWSRTGPAGERAPPDGNRCAIPELRGVPPGRPSDTAKYQPMAAGDGQV